MSPGRSGRVVVVLQEVSVGKRVRVRVRVGVRVSG